MALVVNDAETCIALEFIKGMEILSLLVINFFLLNFFIFLFF